MSSAFRTYNLYPSYLNVSKCKAISNLSIHDDDLVHNSGRLVWTFI